MVVGEVEESSHRRAAPGCRQSATGLWRVTRSIGARPGGVPIGKKPADAPSSQHHRANNSLQGACSRPEELSCVSCWVRSMNATTSRAIPTRPSLSCNTVMEAAMNLSEPDSHASALSASPRAPATAVSPAGRPLAAACAVACAMAGLGAVVGHWWIEGVISNPRMTPTWPARSPMSRRALPTRCWRSMPPTRSARPPDAVWVDARFKKHQLARLRRPAGDAVRRRVWCEGALPRHGGRVLGTDRCGAHAAARPWRPCQWIKPAQRLPVHIALNQAELAAHPLRVGASMHVTVDVRTRAGRDGLVSIQRPLA